MALYAPRPSWPGSMRQSRLDDIALFGSVRQPALQPIVLYYHQHIARRGRGPFGRVCDIAETLIGCDLRPDS